MVWKPRHIMGLILFACLAWGITLTFVIFISTPRAEDCGSASWDAFLEGDC